MKNVVAGENEVSDRLYKLYMEFIALATFVALLYPIIFLLSNKNKISYANVLSLIAAILMILCFLLYMMYKKDLFACIPTKMAGGILYGWGLVLLILAAWLVFCTGGIQSSIFVWLFAYAVIAAILVRPKYAQTRLKQWRPVLITGGFEFSIIIILIYLGENSIPIPNEMKKSMALWGGFSAISSLIASVFLLYVGEKIREKIREIT
ncbi:hypothetical protein KAW65_09025 [candidate division WOR-3 bacterium]|nr:hypothetical protein [candidate division WOR-3 bacterium]